MTRDGTDFWLSLPRFLAERTAARQVYTIIVILDVEKLSFLWWAHCGVMFVA